MRRAILAVLLAVALVHAAAPPWPARSRWPVGKSVTHADGPIDKAGYIDYSAALNTRMKRGVTPENNAAVLLWKAFGPRPEGVMVPAGSFEPLGIAAPPEKGDYYRSRARYGREELKLESDEDLKAFADELTVARDRGWTAKEFPRLAAWLKANEKPLAVVVEASRRPRYFLPRVPPTRDGKAEPILGALLPTIHGTHESAAALVARALLRAGDDDAGAWDDLMAVHRLGRLVSHGATFIETVVSNALVEFANQGVLAFLDRTRPDSKALARYAADLGALPAISGAADTTDFNERLILLDVLQAMDRHGPEFVGGLTPPPGTILSRLGRAGVDYTPAMRAANEWYDKVAAAMRSPTRKERADALWELEKQRRMSLVRSREAKAVLAAWFGGPAARGREAGTVMIALFLSDLRQKQDVEDRTAQMFDQMLVAVALERYRREHASYPKALSSLVPTYLKAVPEDRFRPGPLVYRPQARGYLLYSVGVNGKDDDGRSRADDPAADDLVVRMPRAKPTD